MIHRLKTWPTFWDAIAEGRKTFEVRRDDRTWGFQRGDILELCRTTEDGSGEICVDDSGEPAHVLKRRVLYVMRDRSAISGLREGWCVLALADIPEADQDSARPFREPYHAGDMWCCWAGRHVGAHGRTRDEAVFWAGYWWAMERFRAVVENGELAAAMRNVEQEKKNRDQG